MKEVTEEMWQRGLASGYMPEDLIKGYIVESDKEKAYGAPFIKRIEVLDKFQSDEEAARYAEEHDGIKIIRDLTFKEGDPDFAYYIDTYGNREKLLNYMESEAVGAVCTFSKEREQLNSSFNDLMNAFECLKISITFKEAFKYHKDRMLAMISERIKLHRKTMALKGRTDIKYEYEKAKEPLRYGQTVHNFWGGDYRIIEIYRPDCMLLLNLTNGQFLVVEEIGAFYRYPEGQKKSLYNTDFGVSWKHQVFLPGRPSVINFAELYDQFGTASLPNADGEYEIEITETLKKVVKVKADDPEEAIEKVRKQYDDSEIILDADDFKTVFIKDCKRKSVIESQRIV